MTLEELQVLITAKTSGLQAEIKNVSKQLKGLETATQKTTKEMQRSFDKSTSGIAAAAKKLKVTLAALGIGKVLKDSFNLARTYEASLGQVNRLLGQNSKAFQQWVDKNALTFGLAKSQAMEYASIYGNLLSGFMPDTTSLTYYTQELLKASSIIASNTGRTIEDVNQRLRSGLLGNTEAIEDLGVNVNVALLETTEAFKQLSNGKSWNKLSFQTQQQIRLMAILEQTSKKFGDSIQNNTNYQLMMLTAQLKDVALNLGNAFKPIVDAVLPILNSFVGVLVKATNTLAVFMNALFGTNMKQVATESQSVSNGIGDVASGYEDAGKEAEKAGKKAKGALAAFDEANTLNFGGDSGSGGAGGGAFDGIQLEDTSGMEQVADSLEDRLTKLIDAIKREIDRLKAIFKEGFELGLGDFEPKLESIRNSFEGIKKSLKDIFTDTKVIESFSKAIDSIVLSLGKLTGATGSVGLTIAQTLMGGIDKYLQQNSQYIKDRLIGIFDASAEIANLVGDFAVAFSEIFSVVGGETAQQAAANMIGIFANAFLGITDLAMRVSADLLNCIVQPILDNQESIKLAIENTLKPFETLTGTLKDLITDTFKSIFKAYETYLDPAYKNIASGISKIVKGILDAYNNYIAPTIDKMAKKWELFYSDHLRPAIDNAIDVLGKLALAVSELYDNCLAPFVAWVMDYLAPIVSQAFEAIGDIFFMVAEGIVDTIDGLLTTFGGIIDFLVGVFTGDWNKVWEGIKGILKGVVDTFCALVINPLNNILEFVKTTFTNSWRNAWDGVSKIFKGVFDGLVAIARGPINLIIDAINVLIRGLNKLKIDVPDWVPGIGDKSWGINIPQIPKLARGGIVDGATFMGNYIAGEAGKEMIVPLENTPFVDKLAAALGAAVMGAMQFGNLSGATDDGTPVIFEVDGIEFARAVIPGIRKEVKRTGVSLG